MATAATSKPAVSPLVRIDAHYRKAIAFRWTELVVRAAVVTSGVFLVVPGVLLGWNHSLLTALGTLFLLGPVLYLASVHVVLRVRRSWIESPPVLPAPSSALSVWFGTFTPRVVAFVAAHAWFGIILALAFAATLNCGKPSTQLGWLSAATTRHPWHWNERLWYLVFGNTLFFGALALRDVLVSNVGPKWPKSRAPFPAVIQRALVACFTPSRDPTSLVGELGNSLQFTVAYTVTYFTLRTTVWRLAVTYLPFLRPFAINFAKKSAARLSVTWGLTWYLLVLQVTGLLALKPALAVINDYLCQPLPFGSFTRKSPLSVDKYLLTALESTNAFYVDHTLVELQRVAHNQQRRKDMFADTSKPALIHDIFRALLLGLGDSYATLATKGRKPTAASTAVGVGSAPAPQADTHTIALKTGDIFKPAKKPAGLQGMVASVLEGKPQPTPQPVRAAVEGVHRAELLVAKKVEEDVPLVEKWAAGVPFLGPVLGGVKLLRGGFSAWAGAEWARRSVFAAVPEPDRLARLVDILATLSVASVDEDNYGYVQAVLPSVLEALVRVRNGAQALGADLVATAPKVSSTAADDARRDTARVAAVAEQGILRIAERFGNTLTAFRFPSNVAQSLTDVCRAS